jgi:hypothetical protein
LKHTTTRFLLSHFANKHSIATTTSPPPIKRSDSAISMSSGYVALLVSQKSRHQFLTSPQSPHPRSHQQHLRLSHPAPQALQARPKQEQPAPKAASARVRRGVRPGRRATAGAQTGRRPPHRPRAPVAHYRPPRQGRREGQFAQDQDRAGSGSRGRDLRKSQG